MYFGHILDGVSLHLALQPEGPKILIGSIDYSTSAGLAELNTLNVHLQAVIAELCGMFPLRTKRMYVQLLDGVVQYSLVSRHGTTAALLPAPYVIDDVALLGSDNPFEDDILVISNIFGFNTITEVTGDEITINQRGNTEAIKIDGVVNLLVPSSYYIGGLRALEVRYQSAKIGWVYSDSLLATGTTADMWSADKYWIPLSVVFTEAIILYIAWKMLRSVDLGEENSSAYSYSVKYAQELNRLKLLNPFAEENYGTAKVENTGWV